MRQSAMCSVLLIMYLLESQIIHGFPMIDNVAQERNNYHAKQSECAHVFVRECYNRCFYFGKMCKKFCMRKRKCVAAEDNHI